MYERPFLRFLAETFIEAALRMGARTATVDFFAF